MTEKVYFSLTVFFAFGTTWRNFLVFQVKLTVQGEVANASTILQQTFVVEYIVNNQMCDDCHRVEAKDTWNASVSVFALDCACISLVITPGRTAKGAIEQNLPSLEIH